MPCCTFQRRPDAFHPVGIFVVVGLLILVGLPLALLLHLAGALVPALARRGRRLLSAVAIGRQVVASDFLHPRYRCDLSARVLGRSPWLAGLLYRELNLVVLLALWAALATSVAGVAMLLG